MQTRRPATLGVSITFFVIASIFVALRFISRVFFVRRVVFHDYLMLIAWVCASPGRGVLCMRPAWLWTELWASLSASSAHPGDFEGIYL